MSEGVRILVLEDQEIDAELIEDELRRDGLAVDVHRVATEAEYAAGLRHPALRLILSDHTLPGYDGLAALARARAERPEVPFIFVTGTLGEEAAIDALHHGATDYVLKQRLSRLRPAVRRALAEVAKRERVEALEAEVRREQQRLSAFFAGAPAGMALLDRELRYLMVNDALAMINGVPAAAHLGRTVGEVLPDLAPRLEPLFRLVLATGEVARNVELSGATRPDGLVRDWLASCFPIAGADGRPDGLGAVVMGITEVKRTQAALLESEKRFRSLVNAMEDSVFILDREERLVGAYGRFPGGAAQVGRRWCEVQPDASVDHAAAARRALGGEVVVYEWTSDEGPRGRRNVQTCLSPMRSESGEITGLVGVGRDVTELKQIQAGLLASERMASVGLLAAGVAHEINNPLAVISANLEIAAQELGETAGGPGGRGTRSKLAECLGDAREAAERVREIVRDLKVFSRADDGARQSVVAPDRVLDSAARMAWNEIKHRARLVKDYRPVPAVQGNESRVGQVFLNLLVNAAQAIPEGHADEHEIRATTRTGPDGWAVIEISDTGEGMSPEVVERLFTPFFTTKPAGVGTGLGLSICHRIVEALGGRITVTSAPAGGSTFRVLLPPAPAPADAAPLARVPPEPATRRGRVLVVDDEPAIGKTLKRILAREHEVVAMTRASDAIGAIADGRRFDVILCDVLMPQATGMEVYAQLKEIAPDQASRIIFVTGGAFTSGARTFLDEVPNDRLDKPFDLDRLRAVVNAHVR